MEILQSVVTAVVVAAMGFVLARIGNQRFEALERALGAQRAETRDDIAQLRTEMSQLRTEIRDDIAQLRTETRDDIGQLRTETSQLRTEVRTDFRRLEDKVDAMRGDLTQVALAVGLRRAEGSG